jgi:hypothetical protein
MEKAMEIAKSLDKDAVFVIGEQYMVRTATYHHHGTVTAVKKLGDYICVSFTNLQLINESGTLKDAYSSKKFKDAEYEPDTDIWVHAMTDHAKWSLIV